MALTLIREPSSWPSTSSTAERRRPDRALDSRPTTLDTESPTMVSRRAPAVVMLLSNADPWLGGTEKQALALGRALESRGVGVCVVGKRQTNPASGLKQVCFPKSGHAFLCSFVIWSLRRRQEFDIIHAHTPRIGIIACVVGRILSKPVIVKIPSMKAVADVGRLLRRPVRRRLLMTCARFVAVSTEMVDALRQVGIPSQRICHLPNGVESAPVVETGEYTEPGLRLHGDGRAPVVLYVGRLVEEKGVDRLLAAWAKMPDRDRVTLLIVGDGPLRGGLESQAGNLTLFPSVRFLGEHVDLAPFYAAADVFVLPSRTEGMSNALLEAMAAAVPPVVSDTGGNRDLVEDGVSGFLVDWEDATSCAGLLASLLVDADLRRRTGHAARLRASAFTIAHVAKRYERLYQAVLDGRGTHR
jgi:glycosyltransferase involved in cell wall biosynthesis